MLAKTGLLVVSNPKHISKLLIDAQKTVKNTLYIQLLSALSDPLGGFHTNIFNTPPKLSRTIYLIYSEVRALNVRFTFRLTNLNIGNTAL